jgi:transposase
MRPGQKFTEKQRLEVEEALKSAGTKEEFQRVQAVLLRMKFGLRASEIAETLNMHTASVWRIHARFFNEGGGIFKSKEHGGRHRENLALKEEKQLLEPFLKTAERSGILIVSRIKKAYENKLGRSVPESTVYRMLERHGWRKITPRPCHPKMDEEKQREFKKTSEI